MSSLSLRGEQITGFLRVVVGTRPDFTARPGRRCEKQGYLLTQPLQCSVNTVLLAARLGPASHKGSAFSRGPEVNLLPDRMTAVWSKNGSKRCIMEVEEGWRISVCLQSMLLG